MSSHHTFTSSTFTSSSSSSDNNGQPHTTTTTESTTYDSNHGGHSYRRHEETGRDTIEERHEIPAGTIANDNTGAGDVRDTGRRIEDVTDREEIEQMERDKKYLEAMEEEYAKREGGA